MTRRLASLALAAVLLTASACGSSGDGSPAGGSSAGGANKIKAQGARPVAWDYVDPAPDLTIATYFTSTKLIQENPDLVKRFTDAINESLAYADAHGDEVRQVVGTYTKIDQQTLAAMTLPKWPTEVNRASLDKLAELGQADNVFPTAPDLGKLLP